MLISSLDPNKLLWFNYQSIWFWRRIVSPSYLKILLSKALPYDSNLIRTLQIPQLSILHICKAFFSCFKEAEILSLSKTILIQKIQWPFNEIFNVAFLRQLNNYYLLIKKIFLKVLLYIKKLYSQKLNCKKASELGS